MHKATAIAAGIVAISGAAATILATDLADHHVGAITVAAFVTGTLSSGLSLAHTIGEAIRTTVYTCPTPDCAVTIRAAGADPDELARLRSLATDHSRHGTTR